MSEKFPPLLNACLSTGAVVAGVVGYLLMPPVASQVIAGAFIAPTPNPAVAAMHPEIRRIQAAEAKNLPNVLFVDVRTEREYERGHIKGALWAPLEKMTLEADKLPRDRPIVLYCT